MLWSAISLGCEVGMIVLNYNKIWLVMKLVKLLL